MNYGFTLRKNHLNSGFHTDIKCPGHDYIERIMINYYLKFKTSYELLHSIKDFEHVDTIWCYVKC